MDARRFLEALSESKDYKPPSLDLSSYITPKERQRFLTKMKNHLHCKQKFRSVIEAELKRRGISAEQLQKSIH